MTTRQKEIQDMKKKKTWVMIADAARARFFRLTDKRRLEPAFDEDIVGTTLKSSEISSDRPGRVFDSAGDGRHGAEPATDPKRHAKFELAHEVCGILDAERKKQSFEQLVIVAPPQFLGDLRTVLSDHVKHLIVVEVNKDLSMLSETDLESHLADVLPRR